MTEARYLLDTNILVYLVAGSSLALRNRLEQERPDAVVTSALCVAEALFGIEKTIGAKESLDRLLVAIEPVPFDLGAATVFPSIPFRRGRLDRLIAAQALSRNLTIVTNNTRNFVDVPRLKVEDWTK